MADNVLASILGWLRAGYPDGIPTSDYHPLLALMRRTVTDEQFDAIVDALDDETATPTIADVRSVIAQVTDEPPSEDAVRQVAARLVAAGWPIARTDPMPPEAELPLVAKRGVVARVLDWLRAGYPEGVPASDYVPLFALLRRRLTDDEVIEVADALVAEAGEGAEVARVEAQIAISKVIDELPSEEDVRRVGERLAGAGFTLS